MLGYVQVANVILLVSDTFAWYFRGNTSSTGYVIVRVSNFVVFAMGYIMVALFTTYLYYLIPEEKRVKIRKTMYSTYIICICALICLVISQFTNWFYYFDEKNRYCRSSSYWVTILWGFIGMVLLIFLLLKNRKDISRFNFLSIMIYASMPMVTLIIQLLIYGMSILNIGITSASLLAFMSFEMEQSREMIKIERQLSDMRVEILISQIKPHFIFNILSTIKYLCKENPDEASETIDELSIYLREVMDVINSKKMISIKDELDHIRNYVLLEQKRFGQRVRVEYSIEECDFDIPAFSLQPIVENAIKHGISKKREGGTVKVSTGHNEMGNYVIVEDDGVGFDTSVDLKDGQNHIGVKNVRNRIESMCDQMKK